MKRSPKRSYYDLYMTCEIQEQFTTYCCQCSGTCYTSLPVNINGFIETRRSPASQLLQRFEAFSKRAGPQPPAARCRSCYQLQAVYLARSDRMWLHL